MPFDFKTNQISEETHIIQEVKRHSMPFDFFVIPSNLTSEEKRKKKLSKKNVRIPSGFFEFLIVINRKRKILMISENQFRSFQIRTQRLNLILKLYLNGKEK